MKNFYPSLLFFLVCFLWIPEIGSSSIRKSFPSGENKTQSRPHRVYFSSLKSGNHPKIYFFRPMHLRRDTDTLHLKYPLSFQPNILKRRRRSIDLEDPLNIVRTVEFDPLTKMYIISETVGGRPYRTPQYLTFEEYSKYQLQEAQRNYFKEKAGGSSIVKNRGLIPTLTINSALFDRLFGGNKIDIHPQGEAELTFAYQHNRNDNPLFTERQRSQGSLDFTERIQLNVVGQIGEKLKILTNFNTESQFDFENQVKFEYTGKPDEIIRKIELGNVSLPLPTTLITGTQNLFGIKTELQFGRLGITTILSQQKSQRKTIDINNGTQQNTFKFSADNYDANRHYFLAQYFRDNYNNALKNLPIINSPVVISRIEVWVTNKTTGINSSARDIVGFLDLGERTPYNSLIQGGISGFNSPYPCSKNDPVFRTQPSNNLLSKIPVDARNSNSVSLSNFFGGIGGSDNFAKVRYARMLLSTEYTLNPTLGYISLNQPLNADEILSVAYQYTIGGIQYQVGELSSDLPVNQTQPNVLYTKLLKNATVKVNLPTWKLQMKNIYSLGAYQVNPTNFTLNITRLDEKSGVQELVINAGNNQGKRWLQLTQMDNLNAQQERIPDGVFDFIQNVTIDATAGNIIFPVLEPFGSDLAKQFLPAELGSSGIAEKYIFQPLYDSTKFQAQQFPTLDRFYLKGTYQSSSTGDFNLNAFNIPQGSVIVTAGGIPLVEGQDFSVDYSLGKVKILNQSLLTSGIPIQVNLEDNSLYGLQQKSLIGTRLDYIFNRDFHLGATLMNLSEKPLTQKINVGDESINNTLLGFDGGYFGSSKWLTKMVNKIPFLQKSNTPSTFTLNGEFAKMIPGHNKALNFGGDNGVAYIDDFESTRSIIDLRSAVGWAISGTPQRFPESNLIDQLDYGFNRANLSFYNIDPVFYDKSSTLTPPNIQNNLVELSNPRVREVDEPEIFPSLPIVNGQSILTNTFDLAFYPKVRGPYNYDINHVNTDGTLTNPQGRWGGIIRSLQSTDFQALNVQYIEFWVMDPFYANPTLTTGNLYFNLGSISEDILKDGRISLENAIPGTGVSIPGINGALATTGTDSTAVDTTAWGAVARNQPVTQSFDNDPNARLLQDIGLDGLSDVNEPLYFKNYLNGIKNKVNPTVYSALAADPSSDDYHYFRGGDLDQAGANILKRYQYYNGLEGNSNTSDQSTASTGISSTASTSLPDGEDVNRDNNLSTDESYFEYRFSIHRDSMVVGKNNIVAIQTSTVQLPNSISQTVKWYQVKIPILSPLANIGGISDFKTIRFIRMYMTGFEDTAVLRFGRLQLLRGEWRPFETNILTQVIKDHNVPINAVNSSTADVGTVSLQENSTNRPGGIEYNLPPGIVQQQSTSSLQQNLFLNEQSLVYNFNNLTDGFTSLAYKNLGGLDSRRYKRLKLFMHLEAAQASTNVNPGILSDGDIHGILRLGQDYINNYYEYDVPLTVTPQNSGQDPSRLWPDGNQIDVALQTLKNAKLARNLAIAKGLARVDSAYEYTDPDNPANTVRIVGNPDLSNIIICMLGVRNPYKLNAKNDDGLIKSGQVWFDELRFVDYDEEGGWAANARANIKLADFANVTVSGLHSTAGFGTLESSLNDLSKNTETSYDITTNVDLSKFFPKSVGINLPFFYYYSHDRITPEFDPNNPDVKLTDEIKAYADPHIRDSIIRAAIQIDTRKSLNFTNVRKLRTNLTKKAHFWDIENFSLTYSFNETTQSSYLVQNYDAKTYKGILEYGFQAKPKSIAPFQKIIKSPWLTWLKDLNITLLPTTYNYRLDIDRFYSQNTLRANLGNSFYQAPTTYSKTFYLTQNYGLHWDLTHSFKLDYSATNYSSIDEPDGATTTSHARDSTLKNLLHFGRTTDFTQTVSFTYNFPFNKIRYLNWIALGIRYSAFFEWRSASLAVLKSDTAQLGNSIQNQRQIELSPTLDFTGLYKQFKFLNKYLSPIPENVKPPISSLPKVPSTLDSAKNKLSLKVVKTEVEEPKRVNPFLRTFFKLLTSIKNIRGTYSQSEGTFIPGYLPRPTLFGENFALGAPGFGFILGSQADIRAKAGQRGWISKYKYLQAQVVKTFQSNLALSASLEPFQDFKIELSGLKTYLYSTQSNLNFNDTINSFIIRNPITTGSYSISAISIKTAFEKQIGGLSGLTNTFNQFQNNRKAVSQRLASGNPLSQGDSLGFASGYGPLSQDVLLSSFLSAYLDVPTQKISLALFRSVPLPSWRITWTGLSKVSFFKDLFSTISITHGYRSIYTINSFTSSLAYSTDAKARDQNNNYFPKYQISFLNISEYFEPLFGINVRFKNNLLASILYNKNRVISFSVSNSQLSEIFNTEIVAGAGYHATNFRVPFIKINGSTVVLKNDLNMKLDLAITDSRSLIYQLDVPTGTVAGGLQNISIRPSLDYNLSREFNFRIYYDTNSTKPYTSNSFNSSFSTLGVSLRFIIGA